MAKSFERTPLRASSDAWDDLAGTLVAEDYFDAAPAAATGLVKVFTAAGWAAHAREGLDGRDVASVARAPVDRSKLDMTANQFPLIGGPLLPAGFA